MTRTKKKPGLRAQLKRKREAEESGDVDNHPAKRPAPDERAKGGSKRRTSKGKRTEQPTNDAESLRVPSNDDEPKRTATPEIAETTKPKKESSPAPDTAVDPALLADHFAKLIRKSFKDSTSLELEEQYLPQKAFLDTTGFDRTRTAANLPDYLERFSADGKDGLSRCKEEGRPHTLVVTLSGMRTADLARELRVFQNEESILGKLIAKHMKLKDNIKYMQTHKIGIAISTPFRFKQLIDVDALKTGDVRRIVVDASYQDDKKTTILTMDQTFQPLVALLNEESIRKRYGTDNNIDILVF